MTARCASSGSSSSLPSSLSATCCNGSRSARSKNASSSSGNEPDSRQHPRLRASQQPPGPPLARAAQPRHTAPPPRAIPAPRQMPAQRRPPQLRPTPPLPPLPTRRPAAQQPPQAEPYLQSDRARPAAQESPPPKSAPKPARAHHRSHRPRQHAARPPDPAFSLRQAYILTEIFQPPLALRPGYASRQDLMYRPPSPRENGRIQTRQVANSTCHLGCDSLPQMSNIPLIERAMTDAEFQRMQEGFVEHRHEFGNPPPQSVRYGFVAVDGETFVRGAPAD